MLKHLSIFPKAAAVLWTVIALLAASTVQSFAQTNTATAVGGGTWATATWSLGHVPTNSEDAVINSGVNLTIGTAAVCASLTIGNATATATTLTLGAGGSLSVTTAGGGTGNLSINPSNVNVAMTLACGAFSTTIDGTPTLSATNTQTISVSTGSVSFTNAAGFTWSGGTLTINNSGNITFTGAITQSAGTIQNTTTAGTISFNGGYNKAGGTFTTLAAETINFGGNFSVSGTALTLNATSTSIFTASASVTPTINITFGRVTVNTGVTVSTVSAAGALTIAGNLLLSGTGALNGTANVLLTGATTIDGSGSIGAAITFNANTRTIASGSDLTITGTVTLGGAAGTRVTNNGTVTAIDIVGTLAGQAWTNGANSTLKVSGALLTTGTLTATASPNTVEYNGGGAQDIKATSYSNLTLSSANVKTFSSGTTNIAGNFTISGTATTNATTNATTINFNGAGAQAIASTTYFNLTKSAAGTATLSDTIIVNSDLTVSAGTLALSAFTADRATSGGTLTVANGATLSIGGTNSLPMNYATHSIGATSTINYSGAAQTVGVLNSAQSYGNLTVSGSGTKTFPGGTTGIAGNLTVTGVTIDATTNSSTVEFNGSGAQTIGGATYYNLSIAKSAGAASLAAAVVVNNNVTVSSGTLTIGAFAMTVTGTTSITGAVSITSATGLKSFGDVTVNGGGTWSNTNRSVTINGNLQNDGTFTSTTGVITLSGTTKTIGGTSGLAIPNMTVTGTYTNTGTLTVATALSGAGTLTQGTSATLNIGGTSAITNLVASTIPNTVDYNGTGSQTIKAANYYDLIISGARTGANNVTLVNGGTIGVANVFSPTATFGTGGYVVTGNTFDYNGAGAQSIVAMSYNNLLVSGDRSGSSVTFAAGTVGVAGSLTLTATSVSYVTTGNTIEYNGAAPQTITTLAYTGLTINNSNGVTIAADVTVNGVLTFTTGNITTGANRITISSTGSVVRTSGHVVGNFEKDVATGATTRSFEIGDASNYTPVQVSFASVTTSGLLTATTAVGDHLDIANSAVDETQSVNRSWTVTNNGVVFTTYDATFTFVPADIDAGADPNEFIVGKLDGITWSEPSVGTRTATSTQATGMTSFSAFIAGMPRTKTWDGGGGTNNWGDGNNWNPNGIPTSGSNVILTGSNTIDINVAAVSRNTTLNNSGLVLTILAAQSLTVSTNLTITDGTLNTEAAFPAVSGTTSITGGTVGYTGAGSQTIAALAYHNLAVSGSGTKSLAANSTVAGNLTISSGTFDLGANTANRTAAGGILSISSGAALMLSGSSGGVAGSNFPDNFTTVTLSGTVEFNGSGAQTLPAFNYTDLVSSSSGARTLVSSGTIGISGSFTPGTNSYTITGSTVDFNGTGAQTVPAFNFEILTVSGARTTNSVTLVNGGTIGIAATFTNSASFTSGGYITTNNTVDYNGSSAQSVTSFTYNNLTVSNAVDTSAANYKTAASTLTVGGTLTINSGNTLDMGSFSSSTFGGGSTNSGKIRWSADNVYVSGTGTTEFYGSTDGNVAAGASYGNLWFTGTGTKTIGAGVAVIATGGTAAFGVTVTNNLTIAGTGSLTVTGMDLNNDGTITNNGTITVQ